MENDLIDYILPSIEHFRSIGYWIAFFAALTETAIGIGLIIPGSTVILFLGAIAARGHLDLGDLIWFSVLGAIAGDNLNYHLGKKYGSKWLRDGFWLLKADHLEKASRFFDTHGAKSLFFGRFIPSVKEVVPFIAGSLQMNQRTFMFWNVLGAIGWGIEWVLAGFIFAQSVSLAQLWLSRTGLIFAVLLTGIFILYLLKWLVTKKGRQLFLILASLFHSIKEAVFRNEHVLLFMEKHPRSLSFARKRLNTAVFSGLPLTILMLALVYVFGLLAGTVEDLIMSDPIISADIRIANLIPSLRTATLTTVFSWITLLGKSQVVLVFIFSLVALLWIWQRKSCIPPLLIAVIGSEAFTYLGKLVFHRPRPESAVYAEHSFSFPSGHATIAVAFYGFTSYLLIRSAREWNRKINILFATIFLAMAIGFSRIYLGVHYLSDVWSGYLVGMIWLIIAITFSEWFRQEECFSEPLPTVRRKFKSISSFALIFTALLFYVGFSVKYKPPPAPVLPDKTVVVSQVEDIFKDEDNKYTETLTGDKQEPLNFIFVAKNKKNLVNALLDAGWALSDKGSFASFARAVKALAVKAPSPSAPISPSFWNAHIQDISFTRLKSTNWLTDARHLKIWQTDSVLKNGDTIYVGMTNANDGLKWVVFPKISPDLDAEREQLFLDLQQTAKIKRSTKTQFVSPQIGKNFMGDQFFTDGKAWMITFRE